MVDHRRSDLTTITEADVEQAGLAWLAGIDWRIAHGPDIASGAEQGNGLSSYRR